MPAPIALANLAFVGLVVASIAKEFNSPRRWRLPETGVRNWSSGIGVTSWLMLLWAVFLWNAPKLSPIREVQSKIAYVGFALHLDQQGNGWGQCVVRFAPSGNAWPGPFMGVRLCMHGWSNDSAVTYRYRALDRHLISIRSADARANWDGAADNYYEFATILMCLAAFLALARYVWDQNRLTKASDQWDRPELLQ